MYTVAIKVTELQHDVIQRVFAHHDWDYEEVSLEELVEQSSAHHQDDEDGDEYDIPGFVIEQDSTAEECPYCFSRPCITNEDNRQLWWEEQDNEPRDWNSGLRKDVYKRLWTMLYHRKVWLDPRYIHRKNTALQQDPNRAQHAWSGPGGYNHRRDIMPECVLKLVRGWFPNPHGRHYMGHRWQ